jgi:hypothetical protein
MRMEQQRGIASQISPALVVVIALVLWIGMAAYVQEHLNRVWDSASMSGSAPAAAPAPAPPPPPPPG